LDLRVLEVINVGYGYKLTLQQYAYLLDHFYAGVSLRKLKRLFRALFGIPISEATILRRILHWVPAVDEALTYHIEKGGDGFDFHFGDRWETDEMFFPMGETKLALMVTRDLKTGFDVGVNIDFPVTIEAVKIEFKNAKSTAKKSPVELRCDGLNVYEPAAKEVFESETKLSIYKKEDKRGKNPAIEGHNSIFKARFKAMKSLHSKEKSHIIIKGMIIDYNFVNPSTSFDEMTPAEVALNKKPIDGIHSWLPLLKLAVDYNKNINPKKGNKRPKPRDSTLDSFF
jgi:hypothetical protein